MIDRPRNYRALRVVFLVTVAILTGGMWAAGLHPLVSLVLVWYVMRLAFRLHVSV